MSLNTVRVPGSGFCGPGPCSPGSLGLSSLSFTLSDKFTDFYLILERSPSCIMLTNYACHACV